MPRINWYWYNGWFPVFSAAQFIEWCYFSCKVSGCNLRGQVRMCGTSQLCNRACVACGRAQLIFCCFVLRLKPNFTWSSSFVGRLVLAVCFVVLTFAWRSNCNHFTRWKNAFKCACRFKPDLMVTARAPCLFSNEIFRCTRRRVNKMLSQSTCYRWSLCYLNEILSSWFPPAIYQWDEDAMFIVRPYNVLLTLSLI